MIAQLRFIHSDHMVKITETSDQLFYDYDLCPSVSGRTDNQIIRSGGSETMDRNRFNLKQVEICPPF